MPSGLLAAENELIRADDTGPVDWEEGDQDTHDTFETEESGATAHRSEPPEVAGEELHPHDWEADKQHRAAAGGAVIEDRDDEAPETIPEAEEATAEIVVRKSTDFAPSEVDPVPSVPGPGFISSVIYSVKFLRARLQRRGAISRLRGQIHTDTRGLDSLLGTLGKRVRQHGVSHRDIEDENNAIEQAEVRLKEARSDSSSMASRRRKEEDKAAALEADRQSKVEEAEHALERAQAELNAIETERKELRDSQKEIEKQYKTHTRAAADRESEATRSDQTESRVSLRKVAEQLRKDAAKLDPKRHELGRRLTALHRPLQHASVKTETLKKEVEVLKRSLQAVIEQNERRLEELENEKSRSNQELSNARSEIEQRMVTLGTLVNLNRIDHPELKEVYEHIDVVHGALAERSTQIETLQAEKSAYHKPSILRGVATATLAVVAIAIAIGYVVF